MKEQILKEQSVIWVNGTGTKAHLRPECRYKPDDASKKDVSVYPTNHVELCTNCVELYTDWLEQTRPDEKTCERCGTKSDRVYCPDCLDVIERRQAQRRR